MNRTPVEWISIGAGTLILGCFLFLGVAWIGLGLYAMSGSGVQNIAAGRGMVLRGLVVLAIPVALYVFGRATGRAWFRISRLRP